jgi:hypothetical protein
MQKSATKEQHKFQEESIIKIQNTHQVEMGNTNKFFEWVKMVTTKLVEWADKVIDKVVYITVGKAKNMVYIVKMQGQHTHKKERDTRRQVKEDKPRMAINFFGIKWAGFEIKVEGCMIMIVYTVWKAEDMAYMMRMKKRLIHQYAEYTREVDYILKEVFMMNMEERLIYLDNRYAWEENIMIKVDVMQMNLGLN